MNKTSSKMSFNGGQRFSDLGFWDNSPVPSALLGQRGADFAQRPCRPRFCGAAVLAVMFDKGVMILADKLCSFGTRAQYRDCERVMKVNDCIVLGCSGDFADFQYLKSVIEQKVIDDYVRDDGVTLKPTELYNWLTRVLYGRRSQLNPLWVHCVIGGMEDGVPFLGSVDKLGCAYEDDAIATGFGSYIALPLIRAAIEVNTPIYEDSEDDTPIRSVIRGKLVINAPSRDKPLITAAVARPLLVESMRAMYYRDALSFPKYSLGVVSAEGVKVESPLFVESDWSIASTITPEEVGANADEFRPRTKVLFRTKSQS